MRNVSRDCKLYKEKKCQKTNVRALTLDRSYRKKRYRK